MRTPPVAKTSVLLTLLTAACGQSPTNTGADLGGIRDGGVDFSSLPDASSAGDLALAAAHDLAAPGDLAMACDPAARWPQMVQEPIALPGKAAGLDLVGANGQGLTLAQAQQIDCAGVPYGDQFGDGTQVVYWGSNKEVWLDYDPQSLRGIQISLWPGYAGSATFSSANGLHAYSLPVGQTITRDGAPFLIDWNGNNGQSFESQADEIYRALLHSFAPTTPQPTQGVTCIAAKTCTRGGFGAMAYLDVPALGFTFWVDDVTAPQPGPSTPSEIELSLPR